MPLFEHAHRTRRWFSFWLNDDGVSVRTGREIFLCAIVGLVVGLAAVAFNWAIELVRHFALGELAGFYPSVADGERVLFPDHAAHIVPNKWLLLFLPAAGALLAAWIGRLVPNSDGHGTDTAINAYHREHGMIPASVPPVKIVTSSLVIGTGGSAGCEGPITLIGAGCASALAQLLRLSIRERRILLAAGLAAGVGAFFRAPLAGALFAAEVLYRQLDLEFEVIIPGMVASTIAYSVFASCFGWQPLFTMPDYTFTNPSKFVPLIILALVVAFGARLYILVFRQTELLFRRWEIRSWLKPAIGGLGVGLLGFFWPQILGTSYGLIQQVLQDGRGFHATGMNLAGTLVILFAAKLVATSFCVGSGGSGGMFGPALVLGALLGAAAGCVLAAWLPYFEMRVGACALIGMAGFLSGSMRTPLAAILMVSEITGNHGLLIPSMFVCGASFLLCNGWTLYRSQVQNRFCSPAHANDAFLISTGEKL